MATTITRSSLFFQERICGKHTGGLHCKSSKVCQTYQNCCRSHRFRHYYD